MPGLLAGTDHPKDNADLYEITWFCHDRRLEGLVARVCEAAFRADPKLADDPKLLNLYNAACSAALAGCELTGDDPPPDDAEKARLRTLALAWLRASLAAWRGRIDGAMPADREAALRRLNEYRTDSDLACVREEAALAKLPGPEREQWRALWAEADTLQARARGGKH